MYLKSKSQLWKIHGKWYDLNNYMKRHPGGEEILKQTKGQGDVSALFETYHAFSEIESLHEMISKFEVEKSQIIKEDNEEDSEEEEIQDVDILEIEEPENYSVSHFEKQFQKLTDSRNPPLFSDSDSDSDEPPETESLLTTEKWGEFDFTSYRELTKKIKKLFPDRNSIKTPMEWHFVTLYLAVVFMYSFYNSMVASDTFLRPLLFFPLPTSWISIEEQIAQLRTGLVIIASITWISLGFNIMHDASHYALTTNTFVNQVLSKTWNALNLWNSKLWFYHHVFHHHSFTGLVNRDPDTSNYYPFGIKKQEDTSKNLWQWSYQNQEKMIPFVLFGFPGQSIGQAISYCIADFRRKLWRVPLPNSEQIPKFYDPLDLIGVFCTLAAFEIAILKGNLVYLILFLMSNNILYALNVIFDHDSFENIVTNNYEGKNWLRLQIHHSSNFLNEDMLWTRLFGSINYQIEHHLFPGMSNYHYPTIQPIVQEYCQEHDIPYVHHATLSEAWNSFLKTLRERNQGSFQTS